MPEPVLEGILDVATETEGAGELHLDEARRPGGEQARG